MKKILLVLAGGMLISLTITNSAFAQQSSDDTTTGKDSLILAKNDQPRGSLFDVMPGNTMAGAETVSKKAIKNFLPLQPGDVPMTFADVEDLMRDTGFCPNTPIETGISRFVDWYKEYYQV